MVRKSSIIMSLSLLLCGLSAESFSVQSMIPQQKTAITVVGVAVPTLIAGRVAQNRLEIHRLEKKYVPEHFVLGDSRHGTTNFSTWFADRWDTAQAMRANRAEVVRQLQGAIANFNIPQQRANAITWGDVQEAIKQEKDTLWNDIQHLENKYLRYFGFFGIERRYKKACEKEGIPKHALKGYCSPRHMQDSQLNRLQKRLEEEAFVPSSWIVRWAQYTFKPNFFKAADLWWNLIKTYSRLEELADIIGSLNGSTVIRVQERQDTATSVIRNTAISRQISC